MRSIDICHPKPQEPWPVLSALALARTAHPSRGLPSGRFEDPSASRRPGPLRRDRRPLSGVFTRGAMVHLRRWHPVASKAPHAPVSGSLEDPSKPKVASPLAREGMAVGTTQGAFSRFAPVLPVLRRGTAPHRGAAHTNVPLPCLARRRRGFSRPFASRAAGEGVLFEASLVVERAPTLRLVRVLSLLEGGGATKPRLRIRESAARYKTHGPSPSSSPSSPARDRRPRPRAFRRGAGCRCRHQHLESHLLCARSREGLAPLDPCRSVPFGDGGDRIAPPSRHRDRRSRRTASCRAPHPRFDSWTSGEVSRGSEAKDALRFARAPW